MTLRDELESRDNVTKRNVYVREKKPSGDGFKKPEEVPRADKLVLYYVHSNGAFEYIPIDFLVSEYASVSEIENSPHSRFVGAGP